MRDENYHPLALKRATTRPHYMSVPPRSSTLVIPIRDYMIEIETNEKNFRWRAFCTLLLLILLCVYL